MSEATETKLKEFFVNIKDPKDFAKTTRRFLIEAIKLVLASEDDQFNREWITDGHFWLNDFCEVLDPQLEDQ